MSPRSVQLGIGLILAGTMGRGIGAAERVVDEVSVSKRRGVATAEVALGCGMRYQGHRSVNDGAELAVELRFTPSCSQLLQGVYSELYIPRGRDLGTLRDVEFTSTDPGRGWLIFRFRYPAVFDVTQGANSGGLSVRIRPAGPREDQPQAGVDRSPLRLNPAAAVAAPGLFVVQLAAYREGRPNLDSLAAATNATLYETDFSVDGEQWTALRAGFFASEDAARGLLESFPPDAFPDAFVAAAASRERDQAAPLEPAGEPAMAGGSKLHPGEPSMDPERIDELMVEAEAALRDQRYGRSIQIFERVLQEPGAGHRRRARELLGVARQRNGQSAHAQAEYQAYLTEFPQGADADRVRQRLASLAAVDVIDAAPPRQVGTSGNNSSWDFFGGLAQYYRRDVNRPLAEQRSIVTQSALWSLGEFGFARRGQRFDVAGRLSGAYDYDLLQQGQARQGAGSASYAYLDVTDQELAVTARVGRQTRYRGGILGRFDGAHVSYDWREDIVFNFALGMPVDAPRYAPSTRRVFYGGSVDWNDVADAWDFSVFAQWQQVDGIADREALGAEIAYRHERWNLVGTADVDVSYGVLNSALLIGNWRISDRMTLHGRWDLQAYPFLTTRNALIGQQVTTVETLLLSYTQGQVRRLARDRTAQASNAVVGLSAALSERWQVSADINYSEFAATVASGGVAAIPASKGQLFLATSFIGSSIFKAGDTTIFTVRHNATRSSDTSTVIFDLRYPLSRGLRLSPRLALSYRDTVTGGRQWVASPNLRAIYRWRRSHRVELELGGHWSSTQQPIDTVLFLYGSDTREESSGYFLNVGYWMDFG